MIDNVRIPFLGHSVTMHAVFHSWTVAQTFFAKVTLSHNRNDGQHSKNVHHSCLLSHSFVYAKKTFYLQQQKSPKCTL